MALLALNSAQLKNQLTFHIPYLPSLFKEWQKVSKSIIWKVSIELDRVERESFGEEGYCKIKRNQVLTFSPSYSQIHPFIL